MRRTSTASDPLAVVQRVSAGLAAFSADRFATLIAALVSPGMGQMRYVNAGHPPLLVWGTREPIWLPSTGPLVSPVLAGMTWDASVVPIAHGDRMLLFTDGVWEILADEDGRAETRFLSAIARTPDGGVPLIDALLADVGAELGGRLQPDDLTLVSASVLVPDAH